MTRNPILDELRETRERLLAEAGGTLAGLVAQLQCDERQSNRKFVRPKELTSGEGRNGNVADSLSRTTG